jgi:ANTAR domain
MTPSVGRAAEHETATETVRAPLPPWGLPEDVLHAPGGAPAALVVRTASGWRVLSAGNRVEDREPMSLVEALSLADLVAEELGASPEPDRQTRRAARGAEPPAAPADPRDAEIAELRRTVAQLEHALAARVSIERAIGVLAERHSTTPREAFDQLRRRARSTGRPAVELAR